MDRLRRTRRLAGALPALLLAACSTLPPLQPPAGLPASVELTEVPFFPQERYQCGPAALATVLQSRGRAVNPEQLVSQVYLPGRRGSLQAEIIAAVRRADLLPVRLEGGLRALLRELAAGNPVLVLQNLGLSWWPRWHYAVAVGYDLDRRELVLRSGTLRRRVTDFALFERTWARSGHWALVIVPADAIPPTAGALAYLEAAAGLEAVGRTATAARAYAGAVRRWPEAPAAWLGLGNTALARGDTDQAAAAFLRLLELAPEHPAGWNNLAYALAGAGCPGRAREAADCARHLAPRDPAVIDTWRELGAGGADRPHCPTTPPCPGAP